MNSQENQENKKNINDYYEMLNKIFLSDPLSPKSFYLEFDSNNNNVTINDILINVFINGMITLFGKNTNPSNITKEQLKLVNKYINSIGYETVFEKNMEQKKIDISFKKLD